MTQDIFQSINTMDSEAVQKIVERLEYRGKDHDFVKMLKQYLEKMNLEPTATVLDLGGGFDLRLCC